MNELSSSPSPPSLGQLLLDSKTDNNLYTQNSLGNEVKLDGINALTGDVSATGPGIVPSTVNSVGGVTAYAIASFTNNPNIIRVNKDGSGNFTSVVTAMNSITTASSTNTFSIIVATRNFY